MNMAQQTNEQLSAEDFAEVRPWLALSSDIQHPPSGYRQPDYRVDPAEDPQWHDDFEQAIYRPAGPQERKFKYQIARLVAEGFNHIDYLKRMADSRNEVLSIDGVDGTNHNMTRVPDKMGLNLSHSQLRMMWHIEGWMWYLHSTSLYLLNNPKTGINDHNWWDYINHAMWDDFVRNVNQVYRLELDQRLRLRQGLGTLRDEFKWIVPFERSLNDAYDALSAAWNWARLTGADLDKTVDAALADIPEMTRLLIILLERERSFEEVVCQEHVFGALYDKRIRLWNSQTLTWLYNQLHAFGRGTMDPQYATYQNLNGLYRQLTDYQLRLKDLFDYKFLMEWHWNKMWDRAYVLINPDMKISDQTIMKFVNWSNNNGFVAANLFGVHPITKGEVEHENCAICLDDYANDQSHSIGMVLIKTKCGHLFHAKCLFLAWDVPSFWQNRCPLCRQSGGRLRDAIAIHFPVEDDREYDEGDTLQMDNVYYSQIDDFVRQGNPIPGMMPEVQDAYWRRRVEEDVLHPLREKRIAHRPSWESVLGG